MKTRRFDHYFPVTLIPLFIDGLYICMVFCSVSYCSNFVLELCNFQFDMCISYWIAIVYGMIVHVLINQMPISTNTNSSKSLTCNTMIAKEIPIIKWLRMRNPLQKRFFCSHRKHFHTCCI